MFKKSLFTGLFFLILASCPLPVSAALILNEFSPKDMVNDWLELKSTADTSLKNIILENDGKILKIFSSLSLKKDRLIMIYFNSKQKDTNHNFYVTAGGLSSVKGTLTLKTATNEIVDEICWDSSTKQSHCLNINSLPNGQTFGRKINAIKGTDLNAWQIFLHPTKQKANELKNTKPIAKITMQNGQKSGEIPLTIDLNGQDSTDPDNDRLTYLWQWSNGFFSSQANLSPYTFTEPGHYKISLIVTDPFGAKGETNLKITAKNYKNTKEKPGKALKNDLPPTVTASSSILITEIFPNPKGQDAGQEWLELYNPLGKAVNLENWQIHNKKDQKNPHTIKNKTIPAKSYLLINDLKISLLNSNGYLALFKANGQLSDEVNYGQSQENKSYSRLFAEGLLTNQSTWQWTDSSTPGQSNPLLQIISGTIIKSADYSFTVQTISGDYEISFLDIPSAMAKSTFLPDSEITLTGETIKTNHLLIKDYQITKKAKAKQGKLFIFIGVTIIIISFVLLIKFYKSKFLNLFRDKKITDFKDVCAGRGQLTRLSVSSRPESSVA